MKWIRLILIATLVLSVAPATWAYDDDEHTAPEDKESVEFTTGYQGSSVEDELKMVAEYDVVDPTPIVGLSFATSPYNATRFSFDFEQTGSNQNSGNFELDLSRMVRIKSSLDTFLHRLDHDPLTNLQAVAEIKIVRSTDLDPGTDYMMRHREWNVQAEFQHPDVSWLTWRIGAKEQQREGMRQMLTTSHCASCHVTGQGREIDQTTTDVTFGVHAAPGRFDLDYQLTTRDFDEGGGTPTAPYEIAYRPATPGGAPDPSVLITPFNDRLWFQGGDFAANDIPTIRREIHQFKARAAMKDGGNLNLTVINSNTENRNTNIDYDFQAYRARYTMHPGKKMRLSFFAQHDQTDSDPLTVDLVALNGLAGAPVTAYGGFPDPITYQTWRQAVEDPTINFETFVRQSTLDRTDDRLGADLYWRATRHGSLRASYKYRNIDRDNVVLIDGTGETTTHRVKLAWNQRLAKRLRWNNNLTFTSTDNPYVSDSSALRAFAGYFDEDAGIVLGQAPSPKSEASLQYHQLHALRVAHMGNVATDNLKFRSAINWSPKGRWALSGNVRYRDSQNDELNFSTWNQDQLGVGVNLWVAAGTTFQFNLGVDHTEEETDALVTVPVMDG